MTLMPLADMPIRKTATIIEINLSKLISNRLSDLGIIVQSDITPILSTPDSGLTAYLVKDSLIALRKETAEKIKVLCS